MSGLKGFARLAAEKEMELWIVSKFDKCGIMELLKRRSNHGSVTVEIAVDYLMDRDKRILAEQDAELAAWVDKEVDLVAQIEALRPKMRAAGSESARSKIQSEVVRLQSQIAKKHGERMRWRAQWEKRMQFIKRLQLTAEKEWNRICGGER